MALAARAKSPLRIRPNKKLWVKLTVTTTWPLEMRVAELERFCGQLALENAVLKKALQTFQHVGADTPPSSSTRSSTP